MSEGEISATGQYSVLSPADAPAHPTSNDAVREPASSVATGARTSNGSTATSEAGRTKRPSEQAIKAAVAGANANLSSSNRVLDYRVDAATGLSIALIRDSQTGVVLQQIPGADIIALAQMLAGWSPGKHMLLDLIA